MAGFEDDATTFTRRGLVLGVSQIALFSCWLVGCNIFRLRAATSTPRLPKIIG